MGGEQQFVVVLTGLKENDTRTVIVEAQPQGGDAESVKKAQTVVKAGEAITFGVSLKEILVGTTSLALDGNREVKYDDLVTVTYNIRNQHAKRSGYILFSPDVSQSGFLKLDLDKTKAANADWAINATGDKLAREMSGAQQAEVKVVYKVTSEFAADVSLVAKQVFAVGSNTTAEALVNDAVMFDVMGVALHVNADKSNFTLDKITHAVAIAGRTFNAAFIVHNLKEAVQVELNVQKMNLPAGSLVDILDATSMQPLTSSTVTMQAGATKLVARVTLPANKTPVETLTKFAIEIQAENQLAALQEFEIDKIKAAAPAIVEMAQPDGGKYAVPANNEIEIVLNLKDGLLDGDEVGNEGVVYNLSTANLPAGIKDVKFYDKDAKPVTFVRVEIGKPVELKAKITVDGWFSADKVVQLISATSNGGERTSVALTLVAGSEYGVAFGPTNAVQSVPSGVTAEFKHAMTNATSALELDKIKFLKSSDKGWLVDVALYDGATRYPFNVVNDVFTIAETGKGLKIDSNATNWSLIVTVNPPSEAKDKETEEVTLLIQYDGILLTNGQVKDKVIVSGANNNGNLTKEQAVGESCEIAPAPDKFSATKQSVVAPGACVWYRLTLENQGSKALDGIEIIDKAQSPGTAEALAFQADSIIVTSPGNTVTASGAASRGQLTISVNGSIAGGEKATFVYRAKMQKLP